MAHDESAPSSGRLASSTVPLPVPTPTPTTRTYLERCGRQLSRLATAIDLDERERVELLNALSFSVDPWGGLPVPAELDSSGSSWLSELSNDHSPFEWSITLQQETGAAELRFTVEALPAENRLSSAREAALRLNERLKTAYPNSISFQRFERIRHLLMPPQADPGTMMAAWHSFVSSKASPVWKIYFDPRVRGADQVSAVVEETFQLLGMQSSWSTLQQALSPEDSFIFISMDLCADSSGGRIKAYVAHPNATAAQVAAKHTAICPDASAFEIERFYRAMAGGTSGPYRGIPVVSTFGFAFAAPDRPVGTVNFRADAYVPHDGEVQARLLRYLSESKASATCRDRYTRALAAVRSRPLTQGAGLHSWLSLKTKRGGALQNTIYFSPELYGPLRYADTSNSCLQPGGTSEKEEGAPSVPGIGLRARL